jgi:hypothetical protein
MYMCVFVRVWVYCSILGVQGSGTGEYEVDTKLDTKKAFHGRFTVFGLRFRVESLETR